MVSKSRESEIAWTALPRGLISFEDVEKALRIQAMEVKEARRHPRSLAIILTALGHLEDTDLADLFRPGTS
jgi:hypothetical protein